MTRQAERAVRDRKTHMPALRRLPQRHVPAHLLRGRQGRGGYEGIVARVERQGGHADLVQHRLGRRARPVVGCVAKAVQRRGEQVVELKKITGGQQGIAVKQTGVLLQLLQGLGHHAGHEHAGVDQPVETAPDGVAARSQIERRTDGRHRPHLPAGGLAHLSGPAHERIAPQRHAGRDQGPPGMFGRKALEDPVDLFKVARMVGTRRMVELARAPPEMWHGEGQRVGRCKVGKGHCVLAGR